MRKLVLSGIAGMLMGGQVEALTIGDLVVHSVPGKPLRASAPLTLKGEEQLADFQITLATVEYYSEHQLERPTFIEGMHIGLLATGEHHGRVQLFGQQPWQGNGAVLVLQAIWPEGQLFRRFRLAEVGQSTKSTEQATQFIEVAENDTLDAIAMSLSDGSNRSYLHMMYGLYLANPEAFYGGNMNNLKRGARLRVPSGAELYKLKDAEVFRAIRLQYEQWRQQQNATTEATTQAGAVLSGISDEQAASLDLKSDPQALQQQLQQLSEDNETMERRNAELKDRLARLEQQLHQVTEQVLEYQPAAEVAPTEQKAPSDPKIPDTKEASAPPDPKVPDTKESAAEPERASSDTVEPVATEGLPGYIMFMVMILALGGGVLVWRYSAGRQGSDG